MTLELKVAEYQSDVLFLSILFLSTIVDNHVTVLAKNQPIINKERENVR